MGGRKLSAIVKSVKSGLVLHVSSVDADLIRYRHAKGGFIGLLDSGHSSCD